MNALIVENEPITRLLLEKQIESFGFKVATCTNGKAALNIYTQEFYPLLVIDLGLPDMYGLDLCRQIRKFPQGTQSIILVITERYDAEYLLAMVEAGVDDYLTKPVSTKVLRMRLGTIEQRLQKRAVPQQRGDSLLQLAKAAVF